MVDGVRLRRLEVSVMKIVPLLVGALFALALAPATALGQSGQPDYVIIGGDDEPDEQRWIFTWWDERGVFHGVDSLDLVPLYYRDRAERTKAADAIQLGVKLQEKKAEEAGAQKLRPNLPPTDAQRQEGKTIDGRDQRRKTQAEVERERSERLKLLRAQLAKVEEQIAAFEEGTVTKARAEDADLTDAQLDARLTHLETRYEYLNGEIKALEKDG